MVPLSSGFAIECMQSNYLLTKEFYCFFDSYQIYLNGGVINL